MSIIAVKEKMASLLPLYHGTKGNTLVVNGKILSLRNIKREEAGKYTCKVQSGTLTDETVLEIIVQCKFLYISTRKHLF